MTFINLIFITIIGVCAGSFTNVLIYRLPREKTISGRSMCPHCGKQLHWYHLIPVLSFIFLKGKCSECKGKISMRYPLAELSTAAAYAYVYIKYPHDLRSIILYVIVLLLVLGVFTDFEYHGCFNYSTLVPFFLYLAYSLIGGSGFSSLLTSLTGGVIYAVFTLLVAVPFDFIKKGKKLIGYTIFAADMVAMFAIVIAAKIEPSFSILNTLKKWGIFFVIITIIYKLVCWTLRSIETYVENIYQYISFISLMLIIFGKRGIWAATIFVISTMLYIYYIELFKLHNNDEEIIESNEEIIERDENLFSNSIGDGDIYFLLFVGSVLGIGSIFTFSILLIIPVAVHVLIFRKYEGHPITMYPYMVLAMLLLMKV